MEHNHKHTRISGIIKTLYLCSIVFASSTSYATYYGGSHYKHHYGHYPYQRLHHNYFHGHQRHYRAHYGVHANLNDTAAYVVLGVLGAALLTHIFTNNNSQYSNTYPKSHSTILRKKNKHTVAIKHNKPVKRAIYHYNKKEGWKQLANGNANYALDIFAVQSQQNLISGEPKIGFALAAAIMGDKERAIRTMKKAIRIDANALNHIDTHTIKTTIERLSANYQSVMHDKLVDTDTTFMTATLAYLQNDYATVKTLITKNNQSQSAINLRELVKNKL